MDEPAIAANIRCNKRDSTRSLKVTSAHTLVSSYLRWRNEVLQIDSLLISSELLGASRLLVLAILELDHCWLFTNRSLKKLSFQHPLCAEPLKPSARVNRVAWARARETVHIYTAAQVWTKARAQAQVILYIPVHFPSCTPPYTPLESCNCPSHTNVSNDNHEITCATTSTSDCPINVSNVTMRTATPV